MFVKKSADVEPKQVDGAECASVRWVIGADDGAENFAMRVIELGDGGCSPFHAHPEEHEIYCLDGEGVVVTEAGETPFRTGDAVFVEAGLKHQFRNKGEGRLRFICVIPIL